MRSEAGLLWFKVSSPSQWQRRSAAKTEDTTRLKQLGLGVWSPDVIESDVEPRSRMATRYVRQSQTVGEVSVRSTQSAVRPVLSQGICSLSVQCCTVYGNRQVDRRGGGQTEDDPMEQPRVNQSDLIKREPLCRTLHTVFQQLPSCCSSLILF